jgi:hypothetical protein
MRKREYVHVEETTSSLAISVESNGAGHDTRDGVNWDGEQIGGSGTEPELKLGVSIESTLSSLPPQIPY